MKNIPEKIYILQHEDYSDRRILNAFTEKEFNTEIEYIHKDAFIEKVCGYLMEYEFNDSPTIADRRKRVEDFKKYMEK